MTGPGPNEFSIEDFESSSAAPSTLQRTEDVKLDAEGIEPELKGKSIKEITDMFNSLKAAVSISESARQATKAALDARQGAPAPAPVQEQPAPALTRDQFNELFQTDPLSAIAQLIDLNNGELEKHYTKRFGALQGAGAQTAQKMAQQAYPLEFELFGDEIKEFVNGLNDKSALTSEQGWKDLISYIRGRDGNFEKLVEAKSKGSSVATRETARTVQRQEVGATFAPTRSVMEVPTDMDDIEKNIADEFIKSGIIKSYDEYKRWKKIT